MILCGFFYVIPLPFILVFAVKLLNQKRISSTIFVLCCICPPTAIGITVMRKCTLKRNESTTSCENSSLSEESEAIISVLQGPFRASKGDSFITHYWEAIITIRRLLITALTLVPFASIRMIFITMLGIVFLYQHCYIYPFHSKTSNHIEGLSLSMLVSNSVINLLKASLTDSEVIPSGPLVPFFKHNRPRKKRGKFNYRWRTCFRSLRAVESNDPVLFLRKVRDTLQSKPVNSRKSYSERAPPRRRRFSHRVLQSKYGLFAIA